jgi:hypothetical protein
MMQNYIFVLTKRDSELITRILMIISFTKYLSLNTMQCNAMQLFFFFLTTIGKHDE